MAQIMRKKNFKIQMLAGNRLKICVGASSQICTTLVVYFVSIKDSLIFDLIFKISKYETHTSYQFQQQKKS